MVLEEAVSERGGFFFERAPVSRTILHLHSFIFNKLPSFLNDHATPGKKHCHSYRKAKTKMPGG